MKIIQRTMLLSLVLALAAGVFYACGETTTPEVGEQREGVTEEQAQTPASPGTETGQAESGSASSPGMTGQTESDTTTSPGSETAQTNPQTGGSSATQ